MPVKGLPSSQKGMWQEVMSAWMRSFRDRKSETSRGRAMGVTLVTATCAGAAKRSGGVSLGASGGGAQAGISTELGPRAAGHSAEAGGPR